MEPRSRYLLRAVAMAGILSGCIMSMGSFAPAGDDPAYIRDVRTVYLKKNGLEHPSGLAFLTYTNVFIVMDAPKQNQSSLFVITPYGEALSAASADLGVIDPVNLAFDDRFNRLLAFETASGDLLQIEATDSGQLQDSLKVAKRFKASQLGIQNPRGMTTDPATGSVYILDSSGSKIVRIDPGTDGDLDAATALSGNRVSSQSLQQDGILSPQGLAFHPGSGNLHLLSPHDMKLYELTTAGEVVASRDLSPFGLVDPQGMVFAPSSDPTDDPSNINLFVADAGAGFKSKKQAPGKIVEFSFAEATPLSTSVPTIQPTLVRITATSAYNPPSPDPAGVTYISSGPDLYRGNLLISDSEVDEIPTLFTGVNLWLASLSGAQTGTLTTTGTPTTQPISYEPTGVSYDPGSRKLFFSDDEHGGKVHILDPGGDGIYNTSDDSVFSTSAYGSSDPEDIAFCAGFPPHLFILDGTAEEVYDVSAGANGVFDGVAPSGDDVVTHFDTTILGLIDPEGICYSPASDHLYIQSGKAHSIAETTRDGTLVGYIDLSALQIVSAAGLTYAPASYDISQMDFYIVARGVDNNSDPNENDGKLYEVSITLPHDNPVPTTTRLSPSSCAAGGAPFTLTVSGTGFVGNSVVRWNGSDRATTFVSSTQLKATILDTDIAVGQSVPVTVFNPAPGGGTSNALAFSVKNPLPTTTGLDPSTILAAGPGFTLTVNGTGFVRSSVVRWNGSSRTTTFASSNQLTAAISASDIATGKTVQVTVRSPSPGGGTSNAQTFTIDNPVPTTTSLSPASATARGLNFTLTVNGTGFVSGALVLWNGSSRTTRFSSSTKLTASILATDIASAGTAQLTVQNPAPGGGVSNVQSLTINDPPVPVTSSLSPSSRTAGSASFTLTVKGSGFVSDSKVRWNGVDHPTVVVSSAKLTSVILAEEIAVGKTIPVSVVTPTPGGGVSNFKTFTVNNPVPATTSLSPSSTNAGGAAFTLTVNGSGFVATSVVRWNGSNRATTWVSSTQLTATITAADIAAAGTVQVTIYNPKPAGGTSAALSFAIN